jgi:hypothetical protein
MKHIAMLVIGLMAAPAFAGVYVETVDNNLSTGTSRLKQKMYVQNGAGRFVDAEGRVTLIKGGGMYIIDDANKTYVAMDKATMEQLAKQLNAVMEQAKEQMAKLPPDQRAQMEQMMGGAAGEGQKWTVEVADTGKTDKVEGRTCKLLNVTRNGELDEQICVVPYSSLPGKEDFQAVFASFAKVFEDLAKSVPMLAGKMENEFSAQKKANGFPVRRRAYENGSLINEESVVKVWREEAVPASMFEVPAGYKVKSMPMGPQPPGQ